MVPYFVSVSRRDVNYHVPRLLGSYEPWAMAFLIMVNVAIVTPSHAFCSACFQPRMDNNARTVRTSVLPSQPRPCSVLKGGTIDINALTKVYTHQIVFSLLAVEADAAACRWS